MRARVRVCMLKSNNDKPRRTVAPPPHSAALIRTSIVLMRTGHARNNLLRKRIARRILIALGARLVVYEIITDQCGVAAGATSLS